MSAALKPRVGRVSQHVRKPLWPDNDAALREAWAAGVPTQSIALLLHTTKDAIIGRAHRIGLPSRPSPMKHPAETRQQLVKRYGLVSLPDLIVDGAERTLPITVGIRVSSESHDARHALSPGSDAPAPGAGQELLAVSPQPRQPGGPTCTYIFGEPGLRQPWHFCGKPSGKHRSWCDTHRALIYTPASLQRADAVE